ncbi:MAG: translation elongation factor Ts [Armatimonadetes bacterium]|nr:translation elongation factor Ts [Armatimonadota bacterium]
MAITAEDVKKLREKTGAGFMDCKAALAEANGDFEEAVDILRKKGISVATKREGKTASQGIIASYIHAGDQVGVLVEVNCETDFVARTEAFREFAHNVAMQVVAMQPRWVSREEVPADAMDREREVLTAQAKAEGKPDHIVEKMVEGRLKKFYEEYCLLDQKYIRDDSMTINDLLLDVVGKTGEKVAVRRFVRFQVGEEL